MSNFEIALMNLAKMFPKAKAGRGASGFLSTFTRNASKSLNLSNQGNKTPRYIYHFTSNKNAKIIFEKGFLEPKTDDLLFGNGIFAIDLQNFIKRWDKSNLLEFCTKGSQDLTILKISTQDLEKSLLRVRSADILTPGLDYHVLINKVKKALMKKYNVDEEGLLKLIENNSDVKNNAIKELKPFIETSLTSSGLTPKLKAKKKAIEFMYPEEIPTNSIEQLGVANVSVGPNELRSPKEILSELLKGYPEEKALKLLS